MRRQCHIKASTQHHGDLHARKGSQHPLTQELKSVGQAHGHLNGTGSMAMAQLSHIHIFLAYTFADGRFT